MYPRKPRTLVSSLQCLSLVLYTEKKDIHVLEYQVPRFFTLNNRELYAPKK